MEDGEVQLDIDQIVYGFMGSIASSSALCAGVVDIIDSETEELKPGSYASFGAVESSWGGIGERDCILFFRFVLLYDQIERSAYSTNIISSVASWTRPVICGTVPSRSNDVSMSMRGR